jgi:tetratricopeptide (TPR) repeat protein
MSEPQSNNPEFLDVPWLLEASQPRGRVAWLGPGVGLFLVVVIGSALLSSRSSQMKSLVDVASSLIMLLTFIAMAFVMWNAVRRQRDERRMLETIEELVQLRHWPEAAAALEQLLSRPTRTPYARVQALIFLSSVLARYNRFDDAIAVHNHLLDHVNLDPSTAHALRLGRAMAMLREDHLFDADRAISELRREVRGADRIPSDEEVASAQPPVPGGVLVAEPTVSAGLALIEMYRDVKTGHPDEAIAMFNKTLPALRKQLGHRVSDAYALAAKAYDFMGQTDAAQSHWTQATLLAPAMEMQRRYPELASMIEKYQPATAPEELSRGEVSRGEAA